MTPPVRRRGVVEGQDAVHLGDESGSLEAFRVVVVCQESDVSANSAKHLLGLASKIATP
jgi:hypothetical protein